LSIIEVRVPQLGEGLEKVRLIRAYRKVGDFVTRDSIIAEVQTDKAAVEIESAFEGTVVGYAVADGEELKVGEVLLTLNDAAAEPTPATAPATKPAFSISRASQRRIGDGDHTK
jgi:pyruvate dehydrogenase E2 component (dihydrolipoamide acetyltransferase)